MECTISINDKRIPVEYDDLCRAIDRATDDLDDLIKNRRQDFESYYAPQDQDELVEHHGRLLGLLEQLEQIEQGGTQ